MAMERGIELLFVKLEFDSRTKKPSGIADAVLGPDLVPEAVARTLSCASLGGRPLKVSVVSVNGNIQNSGHVTKRRRLSDGRYFVSCSDGVVNEFSISVKCANCGAVGHKANSCTEAPLISPCHLCAGRDHEAGRVHIAY